MLLVTTLPYNAAAVSFACPTGAPIITTPANSPPSDCPNDPALNKLLRPNETHVQTLSRLWRSGRPGVFDDDHDDYDLFLRLLREVDLDDNLRYFHVTNPGNATTIFAPRDLAVIQTALDMAGYLNSLLGEKKYEFVENNPSEQQAYDIFHDFVNLYASPRLAHVLIMRNHVVPTAVTICDIQGTEAWSSWSGMMFYRSGVTLCSNTSNEFLIFSNFLFNDRDSVQNKQGFILHVDRLIMPDLSGTPLKSADAAAISTPSPTMSQHSPYNVIVPGSESESVGPSTMMTITATPTPDPSIPVYSNAAKPFPSSSPRITGVPGSPSTAPGGDGELACFPSSATLSVVIPSITTRPFISSNNNNMNNINNGSTTRNDEYCQCHRQHVRMSELRVGMCVHTVGDTCSPLFMFSHRYRRSDVKFPFVRIRTTCGRFSITLSRGHYIYIHARGGQTNKVSPEVVTVTAQSIRPGDRVVTSDGVSVVGSTELVYEYGLFAPHSMDGRMFVDGVLTSCYTSVTGTQVSVPHALLAAVRMAVKIRGALTRWMGVGRTGVNGRKKRRRKALCCCSDGGGGDGAGHEEVEDGRDRERGEGVFDTVRGVVLFSNRFLKIIK